MGARPGSEEAALELAGRALRVRDLSASALSQRLAAAGIDESTRERTLVRLAETGLLDDARMACERARSLAERGYGDAAIGARLAAAGIEANERAQAIAALDPEDGRARALAATQPGSGPGRLGRLLTRRGFSSDSVHAALEGSTAAPEPSYDE